MAISDERYGKNTMKCTFDFIYKNIHRKLCYFPPHEHDYYEVVYFFKGTGIVEIDGREFEYGPNTFSIVKPFSLRSERHHTLTSNWCTGFFINENLFNVENGLYSDTKDKKILSTILAIRNEFTEKRQNYNEMMDILYQAKPGNNKEKITAPGAGHGEAMYLLGEEYWDDVFTFLE